MVRCPGWGDRPPHTFEGRLNPVREGAFCNGCLATRERAHRRSRVLELVRGRPVLLLTPDAREPVHTRDTAHTTLVLSLARAADPDRLLSLLEADPGALELAVGDGASLFLGPNLIHRFPSKEFSNAAA